jgi:hypothetical protein
MQLSGRRIERHRRSLWLPTARAYRLATTFLLLANTTDPRVSLASATFIGLITCWIFQMSRTDTDRRARQAERHARMMRVLMHIQSKSRWRVKDLARDLECSERTVYRDLEVLGIGGSLVFRRRAPVLPNPGMVLVPRGRNDG